LAGSFIVSVLVNGEIVGLVFIENNDLIFSSIDRGTEFMTDNRGYEFSPVNRDYAWNPEDE